MAKFSFASLPAWTPWAAGILVVGILGGTLGITGVFGHPTVNKAVLTTDASLFETAPAYACPGGPVVTKLQAGDRVLAVARSADNSYFGVRNPLNLGQTVWVEAGIVRIDKGEADPATLPVGACPAITANLIVPQPVAPAAPAPDTQAPKIGTPTSSVDIVCPKLSNPPHQAVITVSASDNVKVTAVSISWTGATSGSGTMSKSGLTWKYTYDASNSTATGGLTFTVQARDAAGNKSPLSSVSIQQLGCVS